MTCTTALAIWTPVVVAAVFGGLYLWMRYVEWTWREDEDET